jgi:hypothetical protein
MHSLQQQKPRIGATTRAEDDQRGPAQPGVGKRTLAQSVEPATGGRPLPETFRVRMERVFGVNFAAVRIHEDAKAAELGARAFTHGTDIHVAPGQYDPNSAHGQELLGHELAHVVQQAGGRAPADTAHDDPGLEHEANALGARAVRDEPASAAAVPSAPLSVTATPAVQFKLFRANRVGHPAVQLGEDIGPNCLLRDDQTGTVYRYVGKHTGGNQLVLRGRVTDELYLYDFATETVRDRDRYEDQLGRGLAGKMQETNRGGNDPTRGVHYEHTYQQSFPQHWDHNYLGGYADPLVFTTQKPMRWQLLPGLSASHGLRRWLDGLTIAECGSVLVALQLRQVLEVVGDARFDQLFGSTQPGSQPQAQRLLITANLDECLPNAHALVRPVGSTPGHFKIGAKYYFENCRQYLRKHPDGPLRGENAVYLGVIQGQDHFEGFGIPQATAGEIFDILFDAYNAPRTEGDYQYILESEDCRVEQDWLARQLDKGSRYSTLYPACLEAGMINPYFQIGGDVPDEMTRNDWDQAGVGIDDGCFVLDAEKLIKLGLGI